METGRSTRAWKRNPYSETAQHVKPGTTTHVRGDIFKIPKVYKILHHIKFLDVIYKTLNIQKN